MISLTRSSLSFALLACLGVSAAAAGQDTLARAKDLYVSAAYDEALVVFDRLRERGASRESTEILGYRVLCLLGLGRTDEAREAIETLVKVDPLYRPSESTASPRTRALFDEVRRGLLPQIAQASYDQAKATFDSGKAEQAVEAFDRVLALLDDPGLKDREDIADLRRLASGFRDLGKAEAARAAAPAASEPVERVASLPAAPAPPPVYSSSDEDVTAPVAISRNTPAWVPRNPLDAQRTFQGLLEIVVDEQGNVASAAIGKSINPAYDAELLRAARSWKFKPATKGGVPVRYRSAIAFELRPRGGTSF